MIYLFLSIDYSNIFSNIQKFVKPFVPPPPQLRGGNPGVQGDVLEVPTGLKPRHRSRQVGAFQRKLQIWPTSPIFFSVTRHSSCHSKSQRWERQVGSLALLLRDLFFWVSSGLCRSMWESGICIKILFFCKLDPISFQKYQATRNLSEFSMVLSDIPLAVSY